MNPLQQGGGGSAPVLSGGRDADHAARVERRLRRLGSICAIPAAAALVAAGAMAWVLARDVAATSGASPPAASFLLAFAAMLLILLSRPLRANILRRAEERGLDANADADADSDAGADDPGGAAERGDGADMVAPTATPPQAEIAAMRAGAAPRLDAGQQWDDAAGRQLDAFTWATLAGFAMLGAATAIGIWVAVAGSAVFYGLVICVAGLLAMAATWPRRGDLPAQADGRREDGT
jgi:hypothetical protein